MRCLMLGARPKIKPLSAGESSGSSLDEISQLELHLQRQLEEDIARIFDESIYSDLEVLCGKLKILTHSCILKARTQTFYHKLEAILHVNIGRNTFDEIYSFISDAYTECDIQHQEKEIIRYLNDKLNLEPVAISDGRRNKQECVDDSDAYVTPNCISPEEKTLSSSPSTELTKEYYALVPIEGQILDKELIEQDELSSAFKSFIQLRTETFNDNQIIQCIKPTTLSLTSSHISKINKHSIICDISKDLKDLGSNSFLFENDKDKINNATSQVRKHISEISRSTQLALKKSYNGESNTVPPESAYSPDSLIADEPSSSSDYLSAAHSASPGGSYAGVACLRENFAKMNNTTLTDSGFENNGMLESLNSHMEVMSTESAFHDLLNDEAAVGDDSVPDVLGKKQLPKPKLGNSQLALTSAYTSSIAEMNGRSSKDEKQRQNEEIVILESSSLSSETGSWESVFPPKMPEKDLCEKFINIERQNSTQSALESRAIEASNENITFQCTDFAQKSSFKSASCFIDAASLADEEERLLEQVEPFTVKTDNNFRSSSRPLPCEPKQDISPNDFSESNDNEDSLEQPDPDSIQKDISPTIFQMSLVPEDSLARENTHEDLNEQLNSTMHATPLEVASNDIINIAKSSTTQTVFMNTTPNNSIISLKPFKSYYSEGSDNDAASSNRGSTALENLKQQNLEFPLTSRPHTIRQDIIFQDLNNETSPILSGGPSVKDNFPPSGYVSTSTPLPKTIIKNIPIVSGAFTATPIPKRIIENIPIVSGAYIPPEESKPERTPKASCAPAWVVDMSKMTKPDNVASNKKPGDKTCDTLKASPKSRSNSEGCKSRGSVDSDSSEKSTHKFYIDLSTLPDALASEQNSASEASREKKNIFSMFFDLGENSSTVKEMPVRLSSSLKTCKVETKHTPSKTVKTIRKPLDTIDSNDTFEKLESLCNSSKLSISEILQNPIAIKCIKKQKEFNQSIEIQDYHRTLPREAIAPTIREESDTDQFGDNFVRLSDLDRSPLPRNDTVTTKPECFDRMTRSIPDNRWGETSHTSSRSIDIISSFHSENALSLNRLFPHLKNDISRSMPGSLSGRTTSPLRLGVSSSPGDREDLVSDMSDMSSVQSSMCRSVVENSTTEDTSHTSSLLVNCQSRLGQDLLRMFIEEIAPDVIVEVSGRRIKAHKCILSSRCQYFAGILSGGWVESAGNVISLPPFSYSVVHFALCHIYSGISTIPDSISIVELATIADMLSLEGLKEAIMFTLKAKYCHHFHEPCQVCIAGVLECFPLCSVYGLDDLYRRCLRWIAKHFRRVWPTKAFATLPSELLDKCYQELLLNLSTDSLFDTVHDCGLTVAALHSCRWAEVVARLCRQLLVATAQFAAARLTGVLRAALAVRGSAPPAATRSLDECLNLALKYASAEELCRTLALLNDLHDRSKPDLIVESAPYAERVASLRRHCEAALVTLPQALTTPGFRELPSDTRRRLRHLMHRYVDSMPNQFTPPLRSRPARGDPSDMERVRASFAPYAHTPRSRQLPEPAAPPPLQRPTRTMPPRVRSTKAQEERAKYNMTKSTVAKPQEKPKGKSPKAGAAHGNARPRYLEPRPPGKQPAASGSPRKPLGKLISSSESSRNSSPVLARAASRPRTDDPSTGSLSDSLNANKYATYTKMKRVDTLAPSTQPSECAAAGTQPNKAKATKIPVYRNPSVPHARAAPITRRREAGASGERASPTAQPRHRGSLMMATKSSSAKMVPKITKQSPTLPRSARPEPPGPPKHAGKPPHEPEHAGKPPRESEHAPPRSPLADTIPVMERSGTFLKDEPTFGDITTNIDIDDY